MPVILKIFSRFDVKIYTNDHPPIHVHVISKDGEFEAKIGIDEVSPGEFKARIIEIYCTNKSIFKKVKPIISKIEENGTQIKAEWEKIHGV